MIDIANAQERTIDDIVVEYEATHSFKSVIYIKENMQTIWQVMKESAEKSINNTQKICQWHGRRRCSKIIHI